MSALTILSVWIMFFYVLINQVYQTVNEHKQRNKQSSRRNMKVILQKLNIGWNRDYWL